MHRIFVFFLSFTPDDLNLNRLMTFSTTLRRSRLFSRTVSARALPWRCATNSCDGNDYSNRDLTDQFYTKGSLKRANFSGSNLTGVTLFGADLTEANFTGADLTNANIGQCNLTGTIFTAGAILSSPSRARVSSCGCNRIIRRF